MRRPAFMLAVGMVVEVGLGLLAGSSTPSLRRSSAPCSSRPSWRESRAGRLLWGWRKWSREVIPGRLYQHGDELGYVLEGTAVLEVEGQEPIALKAGDTYHVEAMRLHNAKAHGTIPAKVLAIWIVEKGPLLATPAQ